MAEFSDIVSAVGRGAAQAGRFVGRKVSEGYQAIDPDVRRHIAQTPLLVYSLLDPRRPAVEAIPDDGHPPLVFVHGLGGSRGDFVLMALFLRAHGRKRAYRIHFDTTRDLSDRAEDLAAFVREVMDVNKVDSVDIVAHSLGGIISRLAIGRAGLEKHVHSLTTLGTPHAGTYPARFGATALLRGLRPKSEVVRELNRRGWPEGVRGVTCWSDADVLVLPSESAAVEGTTQIDMSPLTHYGYLISPRSWATVARALHSNES